MERERRRGCRAECKLEREKSCPPPPEPTPGPQTLGPSNDCSAGVEGGAEGGEEWCASWGLTSLLLFGGVWEHLTHPVPQQSVNARETSGTFSASAAV